jgi:hypothetical protein
VGLLGVHSSWQGFYVYAAAVSEIVCIVVGGWLLLQARETGPSAVGSRRHRAA